jgi:hypothetical protein
MRFGETDVFFLNNPGIKKPMKAKYNVLLIGDPVIVQPLMQPKKYQYEYPTSAPKVVVIKTDL